MSGPIDIGAVRNLHSKFLHSQTVLIDNALEFAGDFAHEHVAAFSKFQRRSGADSLKDATEHKIIRLHSGALLRISAKKKYAAYVEYGTGPHVIVPRRAKFLRFTTKGGALVFARKVNHPGTPAFRFLYNATDAAGRVLEEHLATGMAQAAAKF